MDIFLIISILIAVAILAVVSFYLLVHFQHPDDKNDAYFPKFVVLTGFVLAGCTVLLLPLDVANNDGYAGCDGYNTKVCGGLNMNLLWQIMYMITLVYLVFFIPFSVFFYEADDGTLMGGPRKSRAFAASIWQIAVIVIVGLVLAICYYFLSYTSIPVTEYIVPTINGGAIYETENYSQNNYSFEVDMLENLNANDIVVSDEIINDPNGDGIISIQVNIPTFCIAFMSFIGWFFFAFFGGVGLASFPMDGILAYVNRPRHMDAVEYAEAQLSLRNRTNELVNVGELLKIERAQRESSYSSGGGGWCGGKSDRKSNKIDRKTLNQFKQSIFLLEKDVADFSSATQSKEQYSVFIPYFQLFGGILSSILSILWIIQVCIYVLPTIPVHPFLNDYFKWFDLWFPLFGVISVAVFSLYLLGAAVNGCFKCGLRFFFFTLYPMKLHRTYMSSFLFNIALVLLCSVPAVQFSVLAFAEYAQYTDVLQMFGVQVKYLEFFSIFFEKKIFDYVLLAMACLTTMYLICKPRESPYSALELRDRLKSRND